MRGRTGTTHPAYGIHRGSNSATWKGDGVQYKTVHLRLKAERGPAKMHACVDCGRPARDWSHDNTGAMADAVGWYEGLTYDTDPETYAPRCRSCHVKHDQQEEVVRA
jgi:hypothetical protein